MQDDTTRQDTSQEAEDDRLLTQDEADAYFNAEPRMRESVLIPADPLEGWPEVRGPDFSKDLTIHDLVRSYYHIGFQAHHLARAVRIIRRMREEKATIYLAFTSNMISCGIREIIRWLVQEGHVHVLVTTAGGVEEDIIKCFKPFVLGSYDTPGAVLREKGINRTGNLFIPNDRYVLLERFLLRVFREAYRQQREAGRVLSERDLTRLMGELLDCDASVLTQAARKGVPVYAPALYDGAIGDTLVFFKKRHPDFLIDASRDIVDAADHVLQQEKTGIIVLGGSIPKHFVANINLYRDGADYAVYITTAMEFEGSNAGANVEEAISWGKVKTEADHVKITAEASLVFPLIAYAAFKDSLEANSPSETEDV